MSKKRVASPFIVSSLVLALILAVASAANAHESRPGYLEISDNGSGRYEVFWKKPMKGDAVLRISPLFPESCSDLLPVSKTIVPGAMLERRSLDCGAVGLEGQQISISGLSSTLTDVVVRIAAEQGQSQNLILRPDSPVFTVQAAQHWSAVVVDYLRLGTEHILFGVDHLLFVLGLLLIVQGRMLLIKTITAFTVAHSITLGAATLGWISLRQAPVEAVIALSILFLATELVKQREGEPSLTERYPWVVAFVFGLLHGFGFAGALTEVGLPQSAIPLALLAFNVGVELGQLFFIAVVFVLGAAAARLVSVSPRQVRYAAAYGIGSLAAFWLIERAVALS